MRSRSLTLRSGCMAYKVGIIGHEPALKINRELSSAGFDLGLIMKGTTKIKLFFYN